MSTPSGSDFNPQASEFRPTLVPVGPSKWDRAPDRSRSRPSSRPSSRATNPSRSGTPVNMRPSRYGPELPYAGYFPGHYGAGYSFASPAVSTIGSFPSSSSGWTGANPVPLNQIMPQPASESTGQPTRRPLRVYNPRTHKLVPIDTDQKASPTDVAEHARSHTPARIALTPSSENVPQAPHDIADTATKAVLAVSHKHEPVEEAPYGFTFGGSSSFPNQWSWELNKKTAQSREQGTEAETKEAISESDLSLKEIAERSASFLGVDTVTAPTQPPQPDEKHSVNDASGASSHPDSAHAAVSVRSRGLLQLQLAVQRAANTIAHAAARERATVPSAAQATSAPASSIQEPGREQTVSPFLTASAPQKNMPLVVRTPTYDPRAVTGYQEADDADDNSERVTKAETAELKTSVPPTSVEPAPASVPQAPLAVSKSLASPRPTTTRTRVVARPPSTSPTKASMPPPGVVRTQTPLPIAPVSHAKAVAPEVAFTKVLASPAPPTAPSLPARRRAILAPGRPALRQPHSTYSVLSTQPSRRIAPMTSRPSRPTGTQPRLLGNQARHPVAATTDTVPRVSSKQSGAAASESQRVPWRTLANPSGSTASSAYKPRPPFMSEYPQFNASTTATVPSASAKASHVPSVQSRLGQVNLDIRLVPFPRAQVPFAPKVGGTSDNVPLVETRPWYHVAEHYYRAIRPPHTGRYVPLPEDWDRAYPLIPLTPTGRPRTNKEMARYLAKLDRDIYSSAPRFGRNIHQVVQEVHARHVNAIYLDSKLGISRQEYEDRCNLYANLNKSYSAPSPYADMTIQDVMQMDKGKLAEPLLTMLFRTLLLFRAEEGLPLSHRTWISHFFTNSHPANQEVPDITLQGETTDEELDQGGRHDEEEAEAEEELEDDEEAAVWEQEGQLLDVPQKKKASRRRMRKDTRKKKQLLGYAC